jgi:hypothetical protein
VSLTATSATVQPGKTALYTVNVSAPDGAVNDATVQIGIAPGETSPSVPDPTFDICGPGDGQATCALGGMPDNQVTQLQAELAIPSGTPSGDTVTVVATVTAAAPGATTTGSVDGSATIEVVAATSSSGGHKGSSGGSHGSGSSHSGGSHSGSSGSSNNGGGSSANQEPFDNLPPLVSGNTGSGSTSTNSGDNSSDLFPTINPSSSSSTPGTTSHGGKAAHKPYRATTVADILPLNQGQISGQVAGLIVLGIGIILVFARISLRKPRTSGGKDAS